MSQQWGWLSQDPLLPMNKITARIVDFLWYKNKLAAVLLMPLSLIFTLVVVLRRWLYRQGLLKSERLPVPVIVVGNLSVGGTGKTPLVIWLANFLLQSGYQPGILTRGYAGKSEQWPQMVYASSDPAQLGDEPVMIARNTSVPVAVGPGRVASARKLITEQGCTVIISDDGLQHYALKRDIEILVIDAQRRFGNGSCLPGGPLREPVRRQQAVDLVVSNGEPAAPGEHAMQLQGGQAVNMITGEQRPLADFAGKPCHALAGIGNPGRFFTLLNHAGLQVTQHSFPDHFAYRAADIDLGEHCPVLMTEKDAVKCFHFASQNHWFVPVQAKLTESFTSQLMKLLKEKING